MVTLETNISIKKSRNYQTILIYKTIHKSMECSTNLFYVIVHISIIYFQLVEYVINNIIHSLAQETKLLQKPRD